MLYLLAADMLLSYNTRYQSEWEWTSVFKKSIYDNDDNSIDNDNDNDNNKQITYTMNNRIAQWEATDSNAFNK